MAMYTFEFEDSVSTRRCSVISRFKDEEFYDARKNDVFLNDSSTVENILCQERKIREKLRTIQPGQTLRIGHAMINAEEHLTIKKGGPGIVISDLEYTLNRLTGMCAAYCTKTSINPPPKCAMSISLGLDVTANKKLYYSAAPGAERFVHVFQYFPLLCAMQKFKKQKVSKDSIARIEAVKDKNGDTLATLLARAKPNMPQVMGFFGRGMTNRMVELEKALSVMRSLGLY